MNCPGSVALSSTLPAMPETFYAKEGTAAHALAEVCLVTDDDPGAHIGQTLKGVVVTDDMAAAVAVYIDHVRKQAAQHADAHVVLEQRVSLTQFDPDFFGTNDSSVLSLNDRVLYTNDYKHGAGVPVDVENNSQLKYYALGAVMAAGGGIDRVVLSVIQPRCSHAGEAIRSWETTPLDLIEFGFELAAAAARTRETNAPLNPGKWCRWCSAQGTCPALHAQALEVAAAEFDDTLPVDAEELGRRLALADDLEAKLSAWARPLRAHAYNEALLGRPPAGHKLVAKRAQRKWKDPELVVGQAAQLFKVRREDLVTETPISPAQFEKQLGRGTVKDFMAEHVTAESSGFSLVPLSDKRDAVVPETLSEFEPIEDPND